MRCLRQLFLVSLGVTAWALHESDVGVVDWNTKLIGVPLHGSPHTAPVFHGDYVLTATSNNVLAALNATDGSIVWRSLYDAEDLIMAFTHHDNSVSSLSGPGGSTLRTYDLETGHLIFEKQLHNPVDGRLHEPQNLGISLLRSTDTSLNSTAYFALTNGDSVTRLDEVGDILWTWKSPDQGSLILYSHIIADPSTVYLVGFAKSFASYTLHVTTLSVTTGELIASVNIPANIKDEQSKFVAVSSQIGPTITACVNWLEGSTLKAAVLTPDLKGQIMALPGVKYDRISDFGLSTNGQFLAIKEGGAAHVMHFDPQASSLRPIWEFGDAAPSQAQSDSHFVGGLSRDGQPRVARIYWSNVHNKAIHQTLAIHLSEDKASASGFAFPFQTLDHGVIRHVAFDGSSTGETHENTRTLLTTTTGSIQLWQHDKMQWVREEALASIQVAEFVELPEKKVVMSHAAVDEEGYFERLQRQLSDAKNLPQYLANFARRFATGSYATVTTSAASSSDEDTLTRDAFGFRQIIVAATSYGKIFGIDSSDGRVLWSRVLGLGWAAKVGGAIIPTKIFVTRTVSDPEGPQIVLVTQRRADNSLVDTVLFHVNALTGDDVREEHQSIPRTALEGLDAVMGPLVDVFMLPSENRTIVMLDEYLQARLYPDTPSAQAEFESFVPSIHLALRADVPGQRQILGHQLGLNFELSQFYVAYPTWTLSLPPKEEIRAMIPNTRGPIASIGKVLGNRMTLYKYLNPHLTLVLTSFPPSSTCGIYVLDVVKGSVIYHASVPAAGGVCDTQATLTENWLVYHYFDDEFSGTGQSKGYRVVSVEFYEGDGPDDKTKSSELSSYSNKTLHINAYEQSFIMPHGITAISPTSTKFGVSTKDIIVANRKNSIQSIPRRLLNPRRPKHKPTSEEQEEMLVQYDAVLPDDARLVLSHNYEVANVRRIVTSPSLLESTSLVFVYGLDLFFTRIAPSGTFDVLSENFNKVQLVLTVAGLGIAIMVTKPMVQRKRLRERWYQ
jgi:outer membrane protein assembly factor BamB